MKNNNTGNNTTLAAITAAVAGALILPAPSLAAEVPGFTCRASALRLDSPLVPTLSSVLELLTGADGDYPITGDVFEPVIANTPAAPCVTDNDTLILADVPVISSSLSVLLARTHNDAADNQPPVIANASVVNPNLLGLVEVGLVEATARVRAFNNQCAALSQCELAGQSSVASLSIASSKLLTDTITKTSGILSILSPLLGSLTNTTTSTINLLSGTSSVNTSFSKFGFITDPYKVDIKVGVNLSALGLKINPLIVASVYLNENIKEPITNPTKITQRALRVVVSAQNQANIQTLLPKLEALKTVLSTASSVTGTLTGLTGSLLGTVNVVTLNLSSSIQSLLGISTPSISISAQLKTELLDDVSVIIGNLQELLKITDLGAPSGGLLGEHELVVSEASLGYTGNNLCTGSGVSVGSLVGGGTIGSGATQITVAAALSCQNLGADNKLDVSWANNHFSLNTLTQTLCKDVPGISEEVPVTGFDTIVVSGTGFLNGVPHNVQATLSDAGEPGISDSVLISIFNSSNQLVKKISGTLKSGNLQAEI